MTMALMTPEEKERLQVLLMRQADYTRCNPRLTGWLRWIVCFFSSFQPVRRRLGGHWELWWVEPCWSFVWLDTDRCSLTRGTRPPACFGTPTCEDYPMNRAAIDADGRLDGNPSSN